MTPAAFLTVVAVQLLAAMSPGPSFVVCVRTAASEGFRTAAALSLGFGLGAALWAGAALAGLALLFEVVPGLFLALRIGGALFLFWLAVKMWRHAADPLPETASAAPRSAASAIRLGFLTFVANPKTAVFFGAIFLGLVPAGAAPLTLAALVAVIFLNETLWYLLVARLFSLPRARAAYARLKTGFDRVFGGLLALLGAKLVLG